MFFVVQIFFFLKILFFFRAKGREGEREGEKHWPATQACALTGNPTRDPSVHRPVLNPLSYTSQGFVVQKFNQYFLGWECREAMLIFIFHALR